MSRWLVEDGAEVAAGQLLVEVETDKATVEIEAPGDGRLRIVAAEGEIVAVEGVLAEVEPVAAVAVAAAAAPPATELPAADGAAASVASVAPGVEATSPPRRHAGSRARARST